MLNIVIGILITLLAVSITAFTNLLKFVFEVPVPLYTRCVEKQVVMGK